MRTSTGGFAPAGATKGLSARPLETFGPHICGNSCKLGSSKFHPFESEQMCIRDSLHALSLYRKFSHKDFTLMAFTISMGLEPFDLSGIHRLCQELDIPYAVSYTHLDVYKRQV